MFEVKKYGWIRTVYLYLVTAITIVMIIIAAVGFIRLLLNEYVFGVKSYDAFTVPYECENAQTIAMQTETIGAAPAAPAKVTTRVLTPAEKEKCLADAKTRQEASHANDVKRDLVEWLAMLIVALPLYLYHWRLIKKEAKNQ